MRRLIFLMLLFLSVGCDSGAPPMKMDEPVRPFKAQALDGRIYELPKDGEGQVTVIRFWADWCVYCKTELADIEAVWKDDREKGLLVLAVNAGQKRDSVAAFAGGLNLTYPVLLDEESKIARQYGVTGLPATFVIDRQGRLRAKILGAMDRTAFQKAVEDLL
ncbi:MAG: TlpA family protein disulfide reductase [Rhodospirillales bacterium]|nr:TlpA family protein disulfide reductase [Rhodospirillales bacterium]